MWSKTALLVSACAVVGLAAAADNPTFMMVGGISAGEEMCLTTGSIFFAFRLAPLGAVCITVAL